MADLDQHAEAIVKFHKILLDGGIDDQVAGVCTIDFNKALLSREMPTTGPTSDEQRDQLREAAERKHKAREERLAAQA